MIEGMVFAIVSTLQTTIGNASDNYADVTVNEIATNGTTKMAGTFTAAVLALRRDDRVQGKELLLVP